ncbi:glycosyl hydrolase 2 galactose-binding domain-containing protein [Amycolatopsis nalaikhensis]|uniref:CBM35 domain-containing protein n=1 Tax=Amycolatopsis nalaikhensis TaxID=715472 RepID=A0ABY8XCL5_9PSEU|nr:carbohydrate-binding protein [Amycolatopsis sp. 2-2]WIV53556.1 CBM35 domain-containing protein [Amycolatopsis sp. 2-2]
MNNRQRRTLRLVSAVALAVAVSGATVPAATGQEPARPAVAAAAPATAVPGFLIQTSAQVSDDSAVSKPGYNTSGWYPVGPRSTVYAGLLANGKYADPFYSTNMKNVPTADFKVPWWYRTDLTVADTSQRTYLDFSGVLSKADVWVNGTRVADKTQVNGAYTRHDLDITALVKAGTNSVAFKVYPNDPDKDLSMGWIDWAQTPPDQNMGIVRDVLVRRSGPVALRGGHVVTKLTGLTHADLTVKADVRNDSANAVSTTVSGTVAGRAISQTVSLAAKEKKTVTFPVVGIDNPQIWWPAGMGGQPLYALDLTASVGGTASDSSHSSFGVRQVTANKNSSGGRAYTINGRPLLIKGGGYSPDLFLRWNEQFAADKLAYVKDLGLNTVRLEGHIEPDEFFDLADRMGVLTLPGWECCDKWEGQVNGSEKGDPWTAADYPIAKASMTAEAERLRDHPSVISFLIGSDFAPDATIEKNYLDALSAADWPTPVVPAASAKSSPQLGSSGMKMNGPYDWIPPVYWYDKAHSDGGGAWSFNSETSAGPDIPTMDTLKRMMSAGELDTLWKDPSAAQYHRSSSSTFGNLKLFGDALSGRYGAPSSLADYVRKAQLAKYENVRAEFEAHSRNFSDSSNPATGIIYWMLNSGWTSLHWQLFDAYLDQNGSYFGAKKANEPLHIQYSYDTKSVVVVNHNHDAASGLTARVQLFNLDGTAKFDQSKAVSVGGDGAKTTALTIGSVSGLSPTYLAKLVLTDASGKEVSRNVYWLSTKADALDWNNSDWYYTPTTSYADLSGLNGLAQVAVDPTASTTTNADGTTTTKVTLKNNSSGKVPAFFVDAHVVDPAGAPVLPVRWTDNQVSLWPGESTTLTATYRTADLKGAKPSVRIAGWNTGTKTIPADGTVTPGTPADYQAEDATITNGAAESNHLGFTGTGFVNYDNVTGSAVEFSVTAAAAGPANVVLRFANGTTTNRPMDIAVNGVKVASGVAFGGTGNWDTWQTVTVPVTLTAGTNKIKATATTANGGPNLDKITV